MATITLIKTAKMWRILPAAISVFLSMAFAAPNVLAQSSNYDFGPSWYIKKFDTDIKIQTGSSIIVQETIQADYSKEKHHGLFRDIPIQYKNKGNNFSLKVQVLNITDENGHPWEYRKSTHDEYLELKMGSADKYLFGLSTFVITYQVERAINYFDEYDELYWNPTGTEWDVPIESSSVTVTIPGNVNSNKLKAACYTGFYGTKGRDCQFEIKNNGQISYKITQPLLPQEGLTTVSGFPKGIVTPVSSLKNASWFLQDNWGYAIPFFFFGILYFLWYTRGRDEETNRDTIMPIYTPPDNLRPAEIGTIIDESVDMHDISSAIIDLAVRGYLKIIEKKEKKFLFTDTEYVFEKLKDFNEDSSVRNYEKKILNTIFDSGNKRNLSDLKNKFYLAIPDIKNRIYNQLVNNGYFPRRPDKVRQLYSGIGMGISIVTLFGASFIIFFFSISVVIGLIISGILIIIFAKYMPAKTKKGKETFYKIKGLEEYINTAEKDRIKFQENENIFEKLLPYAMTLGLAEKWTRSFADIYKTPPSWYQSSNPDFIHNFNTYYFLRSLNGLSSNMQNTFQSAPRSSSSGSAWGGHSGFGGGGFSGGGFGGGGGGSW